MKEESTAIFRNSRIINVYPQQSCDPIYYCRNPVIALIQIDIGEIKGKILQAIHKYVQWIPRSYQLSLPGNRQRDGAKGQKISDHFREDKGRNNHSRKSCRSCDESCFCFSHNTDPQKHQQEYRHSDQDRRLCKISESHADSHHRTAFHHSA